MQLITDGIGIISGCSDKEIQWLFTGIPGTFRKDIIQFTVWLCMDFIKDKTAYIPCLVPTSADSTW